MSIWQPISRKERLFLFVLVIVQPTLFWFVQSVLVSSDLNFVFSQFFLSCEIVSKEFQRKLHKAYIWKYKTKKCYNGTEQNRTELRNSRIEFMMSSNQMWNVWENSSIFSYPANNISNNKECVWVSENDGTTWTVHFVKVAFLCIYALGIRIMNCSIFVYDVKMYICFAV